MTRREARTPFVPPLRSDDDHSCFDDYDPKTPTRARSSTVSRRARVQRSARRNKKPPLRAFKSFGKKLKIFWVFDEEPGGVQSTYAPEGDAVMGGFCEWWA